MASIGIEDQLVVLSRWGAKWIKFAYDRLVNGSDVHQYAKKLLSELDACNDEPVDFVEEHLVTFEKNVTKVVKGEVHKEVVLSNKKATKRLAKGKRSSFAMAVAKAAYLKFGKRPMTEANLLVTRKWLVKYLEDEKYKDLRTCDRVIAIDRALFLSFVPTIVHNNMRVAVEDSAISSRIEGESLFGKVFRLGGTSQ